MLVPTRGDLLRADAEALVNAVNCVGVMGKGLALQFKLAFPENFEAYRDACRRGDVVPGRMHVFATGRPANPRFILNFPTKRDWRESSRLEDIEAGLNALKEEIRRLGIRSLALPALGCGLGGLDWQIVRPRFEAAFAEMADVRVHLYEPAGARTTTEHRTTRTVRG